MNQLNQHISKNKEHYLAELFNLLRIPSVSADPAYKKDVVKTAEFIRDKFISAGAENVKICETAGHPIVYADKLFDASLPTILVYGHYDVQPAEPFELWDTAPFEPEIRITEKHPEGAIFARGACDDKGQMFMHLKAFEAMVETDSLPCNVKFIIEGEEEVGSKHLEAFVQENKALLEADIILVSDTGIIANDTPSITVGLRGMSYVEVKVTGPNRDLHSGLYGGAVANPINILCDMIASLHDSNNHITIDGFYDDVEDVSDADREEMAKAPFSEADYKSDLEIKATHGESGFSTTERATIRPTLDVNGMWGGYIGEGAKTVLPSAAYAKISMRLVPNQTSEKIASLFQKHFESIAPESVVVEVKPHHGGEAAIVPTNFTGFQAASMAMEKSFGKKPIPVRSGGSIPIVALFEKELGLKTILLGFGLDSDLIHSPNEHYGVFNFFKGIETIPLFYKYYTELNK
ncbi:MAG: dipeptidase [Flavobacteriales bacterium]|nr:dipeptidase [Flavobacteriales bacterium]